MPLPSAFQYLNPFTLVNKLTTPQQSQEGRLLEGLVKSGAIKYSEVPGLLLRHKQGISSAQILQEIENNREKYFVQSEGERQMSTLKAKQIMEQQAEERKRTQQQEQSRQIASTLTQALAGQAQGLNQAVQGNPSLASLLAGGMAGGAYQPITSDSLLMPQLKAQMALYKEGLGDTNYQNVVKNFAPLLQSPKPLTPAEKRTAMENQAIEELPRGSLPRQQELLTKSTSTAQQDRAYELDIQKFAYQRQKDKADRAIEMEKMKRSGSGISEYIRRLAIPTQDKVNRIKKEFTDLKTKTKMDYDLRIETKESTAVAFMDDPESYKQIQEDIKAIKEERDEAIKEFDAMEKEQIESTRNVAYGVAEQSGLSGTPLLRIKTPYTYDQWLKKYKIKNPDDPRHYYDYKAAYEAGTVPTLWDTLSDEDREIDIQQAMNGQRTGRKMTREEATQYYKSSYMWPDEFKLKGHPIPSLDSYDWNK